MKNSRCTGCCWVGSRGSLKCFLPKKKQATVPPDDPGDPTVDPHGQKRLNKVHEAKTDPDARLAPKGKGKEAKLSCSSNFVVEHGNGLIVNAELLRAKGQAERDAAPTMLEGLPGDSRITVDCDKGFDTAEFVYEIHVTRM